jgi:hypothetical protein
MDMDNYDPQVFGGFAARTIVVLVTLFGSLTIRLEVAASSNETQAGVDPVKTFNDPNGFAAAQFDLPVRLDTMLRGGPAVPPPPVCVWINGDYGEVKGRNYLEGGMSAEFVFRKNARYPLIITIPTTMAVGDEEYWFGPHFGYITAGVNVRVPLSFIPSRYGRWTAGSSADLCYYETTATQFLKSIGVPSSKIAATLSVDF